MLSNYYIYYNTEFNNKTYGERKQNTHLWKWIMIFQFLEVFNNLE